MCAGGVRYARALPGEPAWACVWKARGMWPGCVVMPPPPPPSSLTHRSALAALVEEVAGVELQPGLLTGLTPHDGGAAQVGVVSVARAQLYRVQEAGQGEVVREDRQRQVEDGVALERGGRGGEG